MVDGLRFDSQKEAHRYQELTLLQAAGVIRGLVVHPRYELQPAFMREGVKYRAVVYEGDFEYVDCENGLEQRTCEDVKSPATHTALFEVKRKLFLFRFPGIALRIVE